MIWAPPEKRLIVPRGARKKQGGFLLNPYRFGVAGRPGDMPILNPGAEFNAGPGTSPTNWTNDTGVLKALGTASYPGAHTGSFFFYAGNTSLTKAHQDVAVPTPVIANVDLGTAVLYWQSYISCAGADSARVTVTFYSAAMSSLGSSTPSYSNVGLSGTWVLVPHTATVPPNTRYVRFVIDMLRNAGTSNDGYMDDISAYIE